jgi:hypothetical protein
MKFFGHESTVGCAVYILLGLVLLPGRYNWSASGRSASWRGFLCSAFFFCILIPLISATLKRLDVGLLAQKALLVAITLFLSFPYSWLGLSRWSHQNGPGWLDFKNIGRTPEFIWFPRAIWEPLLVPHELLFFLSTTTALLCGACLYLRMRHIRGKPISKWVTLLGATAILLIVSETWMHLSLRSPYTYVPHFERPSAEGYWYHVALFRNGQGLVNADYFAFHALEEIFMGTPEPINGMLIRRPFPFYLSSQFGSFINPYYVMLCSNILIWILAVLASNDYFAAHFGRAQGAIAAVFVASGPGFIMYAAQPQSYLWGYAAAILVVWAHWKVCGDPRANIRDYLYFGGVLSLALLTYDLLSLLPYLIGYELLFKKRLRAIIIACTLAIAVYVTFGLLVAPMTSLVHDDRNSKFIDISVANIISLFNSSPITLKNYVLYSSLLPEYVWSLSNSMFVFPLLIAAAGLFFVNSAPKLKLVGLLLLPSLASVAFLHLGQEYVEPVHLGRIYLSTLPRFAFVGYPAVYILVGVATWSIVRAARIRWGRPSVVIAIGVVVAHIALVNSDVFGHPWLYYFFYYQAPALGHF